MAHQLVSGLTTIPTRRQLLTISLLTVGFGGLAFAVRPDLIDLDRIPSSRQLAIAIPLAFVIPALAEELIFRGLLTPTFNLRWAIVSTSLFVLWHPFEAYTFLPDAMPLFVQPTFIGLVTLLGTLCWIVYWKTGSLWASVLIHWWVVAGWKLLGGAGFIS
ncbi:MAG: CPBP family glutamic-type intramembrane protease [Cyanobacteria bacterium J06642_12]